MGALRSCARCKEGKAGIKFRGTGSDVDQPSPYFSLYQAFQCRSTVDKHNFPDVRCTDTLFHFASRGLQNGTAYVYGLRNQSIPDLCHDVHTLDIRYWKVPPSG